MISPHLTRPLISLRSDDRPSVGGKAAGLGELAAAGLPVPAGFVITTGAFRHALQALDPDGAIPRQVGGLPADDDGAIADVRMKAPFCDKAGLQPWPASERRLSAYP